MKGVLMIIITTQTNTFYCISSLLYKCKLDARIVGAYQKSVNKVNHQQIVQIVVGMNVAV
jgi:hypothetical protein